MSDYLLDHGPEGLRMANVRQTQVVGFDFELKSIPSKMQGAIYQGRIVDILKGGQMAFVDIGLDTPGVLPLKERKFPSLSRGDTVPCQITREADPQEKKGVQLSRNITLALGPVLYTPLTPGCSVSKKMSTAELADHFKTQVREDEGVVLRHWADVYDEETLVHILERLRIQWQAIQAKLQEKPPHCLQSPPSLLERIASQVEPGDTLTSNHKPTIAALEKLLLDSYGGGPEIQYARESPFDDNIEDQWDSLSNTHVRVPEGGQLIIEETAALVSIDVNNAGSHLTGHDLNRRALKEIFHQIHLRNLAGIIIVDLAGTLKHPKQLLQSARGLADSDTHVHGITDLGLLEISRRKSGPSLTQILKS